MADDKQNTINLLLASAILILAIVFGYAHYSTMVATGDRITVLENAKRASSTVLKELQTERKQILANLEKYHGGDAARQEEMDKLKVVLEDHDKKLYNLLQTINELH